MEEQAVNSTPYQDERLFSRTRLSLRLKPEEVDFIDEHYEVLTGDSMPASSDKEFFMKVVNRAIETWKKRPARKEDKEKIETLEKRIKSLEQELEQKNTEIESLRNKSEQQSSEIAQLAGKYILAIPKEYDEYLKFAAKRKKLVEWFAKQGYKINNEQELALAWLMYSIQKGVKPLISISEYKKRFK